tara:strand:+ start:235 stop:369 length:135 start_codon:yes stop_codon:yes gene_type:complete
LKTFTTARVVELRLAETEFVLVAQEKVVTKEITKNVKPVLGKAK